MSDNVRIVDLPPMHVATFQGYGAEPESQAFGKLKAWMETHDLMDEVENRCIFGFNNPEPSAGTPHYGYEVWITVDPDVEAEGDMDVKSFSGGRYAVTLCEVESGDEIPGCWQDLVAWLNDSEYRHAHHQWLEEALTPFSEGAFSLDLYLPIQS